MQQSTQQHREPQRRLLTLAVAGLALGLAFGMSALLKWRAANATVHPVEPLPVSTITFERQHSYRQERRFLGVVEAARRADLGFETGGQVTTITVHEGSAVSAGEQLAALDDRGLKAERAAIAAELEGLAADLKLARLKAGRQSDLQATGAVSKEAYDETRLQAQALAARQRASAAQLERLDIALDKLFLRAPYDGIVAARYIDSGAIVAAGTPVLRLIQSGPREAHIGVPPELADTLIADTSYTLRWRRESLQAPLRAVRPDLDPQTRAAVAVFTLPAGLRARDGEAITLLMHRQIPHSGGWLPVSALLEGQRGVWNVLAINRAGEQWVTAREVVEVLDLQGDRAYVAGTLADRQAVVADGIHRIAPGSAVRPLEP
ncbi:MAG: efflux RND transporter periplasmic adaptor subunit [Parahaliea sp.]